MTLTREKLDLFLKQYLEVSKFDDYCLNGLQVEGCEEIKKICFSVSASRENIIKAISLKTHALIVHHGIFWKNNPVDSITGPLKGRITPLIKNNTNLFAYHLPLDGHLKIGNAAVIASKLGLFKIEPFCEYKGSAIGVKGVLKKSLSIKMFESKLEKILNHKITISSPSNNLSLKSIGIVTGGGGSFHKFAAKENLDAYLTGEISENDWFDAKEAGLCLFAGGHNATEEFGILTLMKLIEKKYKVDCYFLKSDNPI
jgi:dinuclear metal center YbgI/SA1388 family protein